ncbi:MAG: hypothetical protein IT582_04500 [Opitutaceae bacterium]|nr:hypothetical protein [Opitutaceae bacterium]
MFFAAKTKGYFIEKSAHTVLLARTSAASGPMLVEEVRECASDDAEAMAAAVADLQPKRAPGGYMQAVCGVYPPKRLVRRVSLETKRLKEPAYLGEMLGQQLRIEPSKYSAVMINPNDGTDYDVARPNPPKDVLIGALSSEEILQTQDRLLEEGIYPDRLELASLSVLGGLVDYLKFTNDSSSVLVLEAGAETTNSFIVTASGVEAARPMPQGYDAMVPIVQSELGLKDAESARKLFFSNTFDFTGMGPVLVKRLIKELQSSIGFYEVQTGQSVSQLHSILLPPKLAWLDGAIATGMGIHSLRVEMAEWLASRQITLADAVKPKVDARWFGLFSLMLNHNQAAVAPHAVAEKKA